MSEHVLKAQKSESEEQPKYAEKEAVPAVWTPQPKIEDLFAKTAGNKFAAINSPVAGARVQKALPEGSAPLQLYSLFTPNGKPRFFASSHTLLRTK